MADVTRQRASLGSFDLLETSVVSTDVTRRRTIVAWAVLTYLRTNVVRTDLIFQRTIVVWTAVAYRRTTVNVVWTDASCRRPLFSGQISHPQE